MNKREHAEILADKLQPMLQMIDIFVNEITDEDIELLKESEQVLLNHINLQHSAATLTLAFGINTNTLEEEHKAKTLKILIELFKERKQFQQDIIEQQKQENIINKNRQELMNIFGNL